jgi:hypothetical protein
MRLIIAALIVLGTLAIATPAIAQSTLEGYEDQAGQIQTAVQGPSDDSGGSGAAPVTTATGTDGGGTLPFTGLDVGLVLGAGGLLVAVGLGMRRLTRSPDRA